MESILTTPELSQESSLAIQEALKSIADHGTLIYNKRGQQLYRFQVSSMDLIAKNYRLKTASRVMAALMGRSRARRSYHAAHQLERLGIPTPRPVMVREYGCPFYKHATLVTEYFPGQPLLKHLESGLELPAGIAQKITDIFTRLLAGSIRHGDFHCQNLLISQDSNLSLIDLDGARRRFSRRQLLTNLQTDRDRLLLSLIDYSDLQNKLITTLGAPGSPFPKL